MTTTLEKTAAITPLQLALLAASPYTTAVLVQDAIGSVHVATSLTRYQLEDPSVVVLLTRDDALAILAEQADILTGHLRAAGALL